MRYRISGFSDRGEARIVDQHDKLVGYGELQMESYDEPEEGVEYGIHVKMTWVRDPFAAIIEGQF